MTKPVPSQATSSHTDQTSELTPLTESDLAQANGGFYDAVTYAFDGGYYGALVREYGAFEGTVIAVGRGLGLW